MLEADRDSRRPSPRHLIFVCLVFHPDSSASSILFSDLFRRLAGPGVRVTVLCGFPSKDRYDGRRLPRREWLDSVEIVRCGFRLEGKRSLGTRALAYGGFLIQAAVRLCRASRNATVIGGTDPPFTVIALWLLSLVGRIDYEGILLDAYPDGLIAIGSLAAQGPIARTWRALNRYAYRRARAITVIGRDMVELLARDYGVDREKVTYIPHWGSAEVDRLPDLSQRPLLPSLGLSEKFVVQYSGNMGLWHDIDALVRAAAKLRGELHIHFLFIGKGMRRRAAERLARDLGLTNITWLDFLPREQLAVSLISCDVALVSMRAGLEGVAVPSKFYGILASGRAVIAQVPAGSEVAQTVRDEDCGIVVQPGDVLGLARAISQLAADPVRTRFLGERARLAYETRYTIDQAALAFRRHWRIQ